jgi:hypothetical protein
LHLFARRLDEPARHEHPYIADNGVDVHAEHEEVQQGIPFELVHIPTKCSVSMGMFSITIFGS